MKTDVLIVGAGCSGLAALFELERAGINGICLEARARIGGRVYTVQDRLSPLPVELGAEFIHGRPPELWNLVRSHALPVYDVLDRSLYIAAGSDPRDLDAWEPTSQVMSDLTEAARVGPDQSFAAFLAARSYDQDVKQITTTFIEGFNAADAAKIGIASLAQDYRASSQIDGDRSFRFAAGYESVPFALLNSLRDSHSSVRLNQAVVRISWRRGSASVTARNEITGDLSTYECRRVIVTVPLGVLQAQAPNFGAIAWDPPPSAALTAAASLAFGHVFRVILRFREPPGQHFELLSETGFLISDEPLFPAWWTPLGFRAPLLTGWCAGRKADLLLGTSRSVVLNSALASLAHILTTTPQQLGSLIENAYFHDWYADDFSRGAYSYVPTGTMRARENLAQPVDGTLFFAGEATELNGHSATVHGAIASGRRAAQQVQEA